MTLYVLQHTSPDEHVTFIGVYSSEEKAKKAVRLLKKKQQFATGEFTIDDYGLNKGYWNEGFVSKT